MQQIQWILASDIDNILTGNPDALKRLAKHIEAWRDGFRHSNVFQNRESQ